MAAVKFDTQDDLRREAGLDARQLTELKKICDRYFAEVEKAEQMEAALVAVRKRVQTIVQETLPTAMQEAGMSEIKLDDGTKIAVDTFIAANIKEDDRPVAHQWLRENGYGALIKRTIACQFGMGEDERAAKLIATLQRGKFAFEEKEAVHAGTLRAFVREHMDKLANPPKRGKKPKPLPKQIGVTSIPTATIKRPKNHGNED
jgi:hypothetical protein